MLVQFLPIQDGLLQSPAINRVRKLFNYYVHPTLHDAVVQADYVHPPLFIFLDKFMLIICVHNHCFLPGKEIIEVIFTCSDPLSTLTRLYQIPKQCWPRLSRIWRRCLCLNSWRLDDRLDDRLSHHKARQDGGHSN